MSVTFVKMAELPVAKIGKSVTDPSVSIAESGQLILNSVATKLMEGARVVVAFDGLKMYLFREDSPYILQAIKKKVFSEVNEKGESNYGTFRKQSKKDPKSSLVLGVGATLRESTKYGASVAYDYKASGNQSFPATFDEKNKALMITLPESGSLPKKISAPRKKKATATKAEASAVAGTPIEEGELVLEPA